MRVIDEISVDQVSVNARNFPQEVEVSIAVCGLVQFACPIGRRRDSQPFFCSIQCQRNPLQGSGTRTASFPVDFIYVTLCFNKQTAMAVLVKRNRSQSVPT